jgi:hypothetical protein
VVSIALCPSTSGRQEGIPIVVLEGDFLGEFDPTDDMEISVDEGLESFRNIIHGYGIEDGDLWATVIREYRTEGTQILGENRTRWHTNPFFIFRRSVFVEEIRTTSKEGFGFVIRGK